MKYMDKRTKMNENDINVLHVRVFAGKGPVYEILVF